MSRLAASPRRRVSARAFEKALTSDENHLLRELSTPARIQAFLDTLTYSTDSDYRSPLRAIRDRTAHCYDGCILGAALLHRIGYPPLIINMFPTSRDDEHLIAVYRRFGAWGAVAQSNFVGLRFREPIHRTLRELLISYFEQYYNVAREKTLRHYTRPLNLESFDRFYWMTDDHSMDLIADRLEQMHRFPLLTSSMIRALSAVDELSYKAGLQGSVAEGLYQPEA
jgi:hypothetical protein